MTGTSFSPRLLGGPPPGAGAESLDQHRARVGPLPPPADRREIVPLLEASRLLGRGGAAFPVGRKWRGVAERSAGRAVVVVNGAEGEPGSAKDRTLMALRPHLVLEGALVAADAVGAEEVVVYVGAAHRAAITALRRAMVERSRDASVAVCLIEAPSDYVAGEQSAAVHYINEGVARPTSPPRPYERGVRGQPTLVQNVETLAHAALIARHGDAWYRSVGRGEVRGSALVTVSGPGRPPAVREIELGMTAGEFLSAAGVERRAAQALLLGGFFGTWARLGDVWDLPLDPITMRTRGFAFGAGVVTILAPDDCGVRATAQIMAYMAGESAAQCGPCVFGLNALADATRRIALGAATQDDLSRIERWAGQVSGRGACAHPDGAVGLLLSALHVFADEFALHQRHHRCSARVPSAEAA